jgi:hypothetical protein
MLTVDAQQVEAVQAICEDLASMPAVVYASFERKGGVAIGEAGDRKVLLSGPVKSGLMEELVPVSTGLVLRVVFEEGANVEVVRARAERARAALAMLITHGAPAGGTQASRDGGRKRWMN